MKHNDILVKKSVSESPYPRQFKINTMKKPNDLHSKTRDKIDPSPNIKISHSSMSPQRNVKAGLTSLKIIQEISGVPKNNFNPKNLNKNGVKINTKNDNTNVIINR